MTIQAKDTLNIEDCQEEAYREFAYILKDLSKVLPDGWASQQVLAEAQPRPLNFFEEVMPDVPSRAF